MLAICQHGEMIVGRFGCGTGSGSIVSCAAAVPVMTASDAAIASPVAIAARAGGKRAHPVTSLVEGEGGAAESPVVRRGPIETPGGCVVPLGPRQ